MKKVFAVTAALALLGLSSFAQASIIIDTVAVGDKGNTADSTGYGSVGYDYNIGKYEVTAGQYTAFLNAVAATDTYGLYNAHMADVTTWWGCNIQRSGTSGSYSYSVASDWANRPVNYVSWGDSARFANWLHNGQPTGVQDASTTERGAYTLDGYSGSDGRTIQRQAGRKWVVTSEDEWYKAAYYKGGGTNAGYWDYPTSSDTLPGRDMADASGNNANYYTGSGAYPIDSGKYTTVAGEFQNSDSPYGTFDQGGNVWEWNEAIVYEGAAYRGLRGGSYYYYYYLGISYYLQASTRYYDDPSNAYTNIGFRVSEVPGPAYGISNRAAYHPIISTALANFSFKVWGKVAILILGDSFTLDDGYGALVKVKATGFDNIQQGDYASASGKFSGAGSNRVLNAQPSDVVKLH